MPITGQTPFSLKTSALTHIFCPFAQGILPYNSNPHLLHLILPYNSTLTRSI